MVGCPLLCFFFQGVYLQNPDDIVTWRAPDTLKRRFSGHLDIHLAMTAPVGTTPKGHAPLGSDSTQFPGVRLSGQITRWWGLLNRKLSASLRLYGSKGNILKSNSYTFVLIELGRFNKVMSYHHLIEKLKCRTWEWAKWGSEKPRTGCSHHLPQQWI